MPLSRFEQVEVRAAIHAAELMGKHDREHRTGAVIERNEASGFGMRACAGIDQRSALTHWTEGCVAFDAGNQPDYYGERPSTHQSREGCLVRGDIKADRYQGQGDKSHKLNQKKKGGRPELPSIWQ